jgi:lactate dehydrogenase-like 2-hydroxyacid dehydrogenase
MRVVAYSIKSFEKEPLAIANHKKHDITLISNELTKETAVYATGKEAVIVFNETLLSASIINLLADLGVKYIATRSTSTDHIDTEAAAARGLKVANVPLKAVNNKTEREFSLALAVETILNLDKWQGKKCLGDSCVCSRSCDQMSIAFSENLKNLSNEKPAP